MRRAHRLAWWCLVASLSVPLPAYSKVPVGQTEVVGIESPHPYPVGDASLPVVWRYTLTRPGATFLKPHLAAVALAAGDLLQIVDGSGRVTSTYTGPIMRGPLWARAADGDSLTFELRARGTATAAGVVVDRYGYGTLPVFSRSICGTNGFEDVACYAGTPIETASRAVGWMLFEVNGSFFACTGFLISAQDHFLSNRHCISSQASVSSLEVHFDFEAATCGGDVPKTFETFLGERLILTSVKFDFALMRLLGNPSATYGFLPLSPRQPVLNESLYLPQHPLAGPKKVSVAGCRVSSPTLDGGAPGSDFGHQCDTQPGSSGSPVLDLDNRVVGLHHIGGCTATGGENKAVLMSKILPMLPLSEEFIAGDIGCGGKECLDTWRIGCASAYTSCVVAHACADNGVDASLVLTLLTFAPTSVRGKGDIARGEPAACTPDVRVCRDHRGAMKAVMTVSAAEAATSYTAFVACEDQKGSLLDPANRSVDLVTDQ